MWVAIVVFVLFALLFPAVGPRRRGPMLFRHTGPHWRRNYGRRTFLKLGGALLVSGALAFSGADEAVDRLYSKNVRSHGTDRFAELVKFFGERFWFSIWALLAVIDALVRTNAVSRWGRRNFEALCVGLPTLWTTQRVLGANRPSSQDGSPRWRPMRADNAASGHAFVAAIPWLMAARRLDGRLPAALARAASVVTGWSRLNDRKHYLSQVFLGWTIAWNAVEAVDNGEERTGKEASGTPPATLLPEEVADQSAERLPNQDHGA